MKGYFRIIEQKNNILETKLLSFGVNHNRRKMIKQKEKELNYKFVYNGWTGNIILYKAELANGYYYTLQIDRN